MMESLYLPHTPTSWQQRTFVPQQLSSRVIEPSTREVTSVQNVLVQANALLDRRHSDEEIAAISSHFETERLSSGYDLELLEKDEWKESGASLGLRCAVIRVLSVREFGKEKEEAIETLKVKGLEGGSISLETGESPQDLAGQPAVENAKDEARARKSRKERGARIAPTEMPGEDAVSKCSNNVLQ